MSSSSKGKSSHFLVGPDTVRMLQLGHPWVIADRYTARWPQAPCGSLVELVDDQGGVLGTALLDPGARVVARLLGPAPLRMNPEWVAARLAAARQAARLA